MQRTDTKPISAVVVYASRFGNTEKIARSLASGLQESGVNTTCSEAKEGLALSLGQYDLVCVGAPTEAFSAYKPMKEFLDSLSATEFKGKYGFAFDTKLDWRLSGSAAKFIEKQMAKLGFQMVAPAESAIVRTLKKGGMITGAELRTGEDERFVGCGVALGNLASARLRKERAKSA